MEAHMVPFEYKVTFAVDATIDDRWTVILWERPTGFPGEPVKWKPVVVKGIDYNAWAGRPRRDVWRGMKTL
jgi:hypothetical protein